MNTFEFIKRAEEKKIKCEALSGILSGFRNELIDNSNNYI